VVHDVPISAAHHHDLHPQDIRVQVRKVQLKSCSSSSNIIKLMLFFFWVIVVISRKNLERKLLAERQLQIRNLHKDTAFDILIFTQHWPYTVCTQWMEQKRGNECDLPKTRNAWTVHGIWPTKYHTMGPAFCNESWAFDMNQIEPIENDMIEKWINIEKGTPLDGLWSHEWTKHGTCAAQQIPAMNNELKYFKQGLDFLDKFSITNILMPTFIKPGIDSSYSLEDIHTALKATLDDNFAIICEKDRKTKREYLFEIRICFDKDLQLHSCDGIVLEENGGDPDPDDEIISNCNKDLEIYYPSSATIMQRKFFEQAKEQQYMKQSWMRHVVNAYKAVRLLQWVTL